MMKTVAICGSMKFRKEMQSIAFLLEIKHNMNVLQCVFNVDDLAITPIEQVFLQNAHYRRIELSDAIYVVDIQGHIGEQVSKEIAFAKSKGKEVIFHSEYWKNTMYPTRQEAENLLIEAAKCNPGPWEDHSRNVAHCAERIAVACRDMNADKAYVAGLLHDIGRKFGVKHLGHVYDGWKYMLQLGYDEIARICLSHSFNEGKLEDYIGNVDITQEQVEEIRQALAEMQFDEYDMLIQLCDSMASADGIVDMEERMNDVKRRYGAYPQSKWDKNMELKKYFEQKVGKDIYKIVSMD